MIQRRRFASGTDRDQTVYSVFNLVFNLIAQPVLIQLSFAERGHHRRHSAAEHGNLDSEKSANL